MKNEMSPVVAPILTILCIALVMFLPLAWCEHQEKQTCSHMCEVTKGHYVKYDSLNHSCTCWDDKGLYRPLLDRRSVQKETGGEGE